MPSSTAAPLPRFSGRTMTRRPGVVGRHGAQAVGAAVVAAIDHHPDGRPLAARGADGVIDLCAGVVTGDEDQMRGGRGGHGQWRWLRTAPSARLEYRPGVRRGQFAAEVALQFAGEGGGVGRWRKAAADPDGDAQRQFGPAEQRPGLAQIGRAEVDQQCLHGHLGAAGDQAGAGGAGVDGECPGARAFGKDQQMGALAQLLAGAPDHLQGRVVGDVPGQPCRRAEQEVVHQGRLHDADRIGKARGDDHHVEQRRMVGHQHQGGVARATHRAPTARNGRRRTD